MTLPVAEVGSLPRHIFRSTEAELYRYPSYVREYRLTKRYIEDVTTCSDSPGSGSEPVGGGPLRIPDLQKAIEKVQDSRRLRDLEGCIFPIEEAMGLLKETMPDHWQLVEMKYFRGRSWLEIQATLHLSERRCYDIRREAIEHVAPLLWGAYGRNT